MELNWRDLNVETEYMFGLNLSLQIKFTKTIQVLFLQNWVFG